METPSLDHVNLFEIAQRDPEELERIRLREIERLIERAPEHLKPRLRGLQFQIDCRRRLHTTTLGSCIEIGKMMLDSVYSLKEVLQGTDTSSRQHNRQSATILSFPKVPHSSYQTLNKDSAP